MAISYGVYDSRALAMGGSATAVGSHAQAAFYNPALLAFHDKEEEAGRDIFHRLPVDRAEADELLRRPIVKQKDVRLFREVPFETGELHVVVIPLHQREHLPSKGGADFFHAHDFREEPFRISGGAGIRRGHAYR